MRYLIITLFLSMGCSLTREMKKKIKISSSPTEAEVSILMPSGDYEILGTTPYVLSSEQIKKSLPNQEIGILKISKSGFVSESLFLELGNNYSVSYRADLKSVDIWNNKEMEVSSVAANKLAVRIQSINQQVFSKRFNEALLETSKLIEQYPKAHVFYDMKGSILYLMGKKDEAINSYQKSLALNPDNNEAKLMLQKVSGEPK
jgi:tetratricopeptide (TPR) repeat protein